MRLLLTLRTATTYWVRAGIGVLVKDSNWVEDSEVYDSVGKYNPGLTQEDVDGLMLRRVKWKSQMGGTTNPKPPFYSFRKCAKLTL